MAESCSDPNQLSLARPEAAKESENGEDVSSGSEGYETPDENLETKDSVKPVSRSKPTPSSSDISVSGDSDGYVSPGGELAVTLSSKPSLRELRELPVTNWYLLGLQLKVRQQELERIQLKYGRDLKLCRTKMFGVWRREENNASAAYETLLQGLIAIGRRDAAESICAEKGFTTSDVTTLSSSRAHSDTLIEHTQESQDQRLPYDSSDDGLGVSDVPLLMAILGEYSSKWRVIGTALGFTVPEQDNIEGKLTLLPTAPHSHFQELLNEWVHWPTGAHTIPPTIEALETALRTQLVGLGSVSEKLRSHLLQKRLNFTSQSSLHHQAEPVKLPECVEKCAEFLKSKYLDATPLMPTGEWPPNLGRRYSDLTMVERARDSLPDQDSVEQRSKVMAKGQVKQAAEYEKVVRSLDDVLDQDSSKPLKVLMEGVPGVGKSTLVRKSCKDWADGKALKQFQLVFLLTLRNKKLRQAKSVEELLGVYDPALRGEVVSHLQKTYGEHVLLIFDGFDELTEEEQSFYLGFLQGDPLHKCSVVVTSRSSAVEGFKHEEWIHRRVEILGFTEQQIERYFVQNITDQTKAKAFAIALKEEVALTSVSYTPLNCSILLYIFQQGRFKMPSTLTELFETFVYSLLKRHWKKSNSVFGKLFHKSLRSLPKSLKSQFSTLSKLAYDGLIKDKLVFSLQDISEAFQGSLEDDMEANLLSLLFSTTSFSIHCEESHYQFLHLTIQEYLAAWWIKDQPKEEQKRFLSTSLVSPRMRTTLVFYAGITQLKRPLFDEFLQMCSGSFLYSVLLSRNAVPSKRHKHLLPPPENQSAITCPIHVAPLPLKHCSELHPATVTFPIAPLERCSDQPAPATRVPSLQCSGEPPATCTGQAVQYRNQKPATLLVSYGTQVFLNTVSMLAETNNAPLYDQFFQRWVVHAIQLGHSRMTAVDCSAVAKFLSKCPYPLESLRFDFCNITHQSLEIFHKIATTHRCLKQCNEVELNYSDPSMSSGLTILPQIPWFQNTTVLRLHGLQYPEGLQPEGFQLHSLLKLNSLTDLTIAVEQIPISSLSDYETVFLKFVEALPTNKTLKSLTYHQTPAATCESFVKLMSALTHTRVSLTLGDTQVISIKAVIIPNGTCFELCSEGLATAMKLASSRGIESLQILNHQHGLFSLCRCCQKSTHVKSEIIASVDHCDKHNDSYCFKCSTDVASQSLDVTSTVQTKHFSKVLFAHCHPSLSSMLSLLPQIPWFQQTKVLNLRGLQYPQGLHPDAFQLHSLLTLRNLTDLTVSLDTIPVCHLVDYESVFLKFVEALPINKTLECLTYDQSPSAATCESFLQLISALSHTGIALTLGHTKVITVDSVTIPHDTCLKLCSKGLSSLLKLGDLRGAKCLRVQQESNLLPCCSCQTQNSSTRESRPEEVSERTTVEDSAKIISTWLSVNKTVQSLDISGCDASDKVAKYTAEGLSTNRTIEELKMDSPYLTSEGAVYILNSINQNKVIRSLNLFGIEMTVSYSPYCLTVHNSVTHESAIVNVLQAMLQVTAVEEFVIRSDFRMIEASAYSGDKSLGHVVEQMLTNNRTLRRLDLSHCRLGDKVAAHIAAGLAINNHSLMKVLDLSHNHITNAGAVHIFQSLQSNTSLEELSLSSNVWLTQPSADTKDLSGHLVERMLTDNRTLRRLDLSRCCNCLDNEFAGHIATGLAKNHSLKLLDLSHNYSITSAGAVHIFKSLENNTSLEELKLRYNNLLDKPTANGEDLSLGCVVERILTVNKTLRRLDLSHCALGDKDTAHIATGLAKNHSLKVLELSENDITSAGAVHIFKSLENNTNLEEMDLESNYSLKWASVSLACVVKRMLAVNQTLRILNVQYCGLGAVADQIKAAGDKHNCLCIV